RLLDLEDDARAARREQRHIAAVEDRVAETFVAVEQDGLALERLGAVPQRLREAAPRQAERGRVPAPFALREATFEIADQQPQIGFVPVRLDIVGLERLRLAVARQRLVDAAELLQRVAAIVPGLGILAAQRERAVVARDRRLAAILRLQRVAAIVVG